MKLQLLLVFALMFAFSFDAAAVTTVVADVDNTSVTMEKDNSKLNVFQKIGKWYKMKKAKLTTWVVKKMLAMDFEDPKSVIRLAVICALAAIVISVVGAFTVSALWYLGYLLWLAAVVLFWYWVYLKFIK